MSNQQDTKKKNPNVPTLRFLDSGQWNETPLSSIAKIIGGGTPETSVSTYWGGDIQWFTPSEVGKEKYVFKSERTITEKGLRESSAKLLPFGTILLSSRASIGPASILANRDGATTNQGFQSIVPNNSSDSEFIYYAICAPRIQKALKRKASGSTFPEISHSEVERVRIFMPDNLKERSKISNFLTIIDRRIEVQNKIIEELSTLIIQLCRTMRTSQDCHLGDLCSCKTSQIKEGDLQPVGQYPVYGAAGLAGRLDTFEFSKPGIAIIKDGAGVGRSYEIKSEHYSVLGTMALLLPNDGVPTSFLWAAVLGLNFKSYVVGSGIPHIYFKNYSHAEIAEPSTYNITLSRLISLLKGKRENAEEALTSLQSQKAFFLANMFI